MQDLSLQCRCATVRGTITDLAPGRFQRVVCYCDDCQAFAQWIERNGGERFTDSRAGSDVFQVWPAHVRITDGVEKLALLRLSEKGLLRWYTDCCKTPAGNMLANHRSPFVGIPTAFVRARDGQSLDSVIGAPSAYIQGKFAPGGCPPHAHPSAPLGVITSSAKFLLRGLFAKKFSPSPYFDGDAPRVLARVLRRAERDALRTATP
ncbi:MAG: DUF6151 family protein [Polyangiales bacterium]